jgi:hypothetical protein
METILTGFGYPNRPPQHTIGNNMPPLVLQHAAMPQHENTSNGIFSLLNIVRSELPFQRTTCELPSFF